MEKKLRPSVILAETDLDVTVCFITTQIEWRESTDMILNPTQINGLHKISLLRIGKIATIEKSLIKGIMGRLTTNEVLDLNTKLKIVFKL